MGFKFYKMKRLILSLVFLLAVGVSFINASSNDEVLPNSKEAIEVVEEFGCASDCVQASREGALAFAEDHEDRSPEGELMQLYGNFYTACYSANCA